MDSRRSSTTIRAKSIAVLQSIARVNFPAEPSITSRVELSARTLGHTTPAIRGRRLIHFVLGNRQSTSRAQWHEGYRVFRRAGWRTFPARRIAIVTHAPCASRVVADAVLFLAYGRVVDPARGSPLTPPRSVLERMKASPRSDRGCAHEHHLTWATQAASSPRAADRMRAPGLAYSLV